MSSDIEHEALGYAIIRKENKWCPYLEKVCTNGCLAHLTCTTMTGDVEYCRRMYNDSVLTLSTLEISEKIKE